MFFFFFFQAEDGIRDSSVTGVQTCALPICVSLWVTGMRENLPELPGVIDLAARIGVEEVYLQRMVFGFSGDGVGFEKALARADESIYDSRYRPQAEAFIGEAERRAKVHGVRFRGADALSPRES